MAAAKAARKSKQARGFGWVPDRPDQRDQRYAPPPALMQTLPPKMDLTSKCPPVYDQGQIGSCTANAIAAAIQFDRRKQSLADFVPSRLFIYYNERAMEGTIASDAGAYIRDGIKSVHHQGDCPETEWPYDITQFAVKPPAPCFTDAKKYKAVSYQRVDRNLSQMKGCLASGYPFVYGISVYQSFPMNTKTGDIPLPASSEQQEGGHAMLAVGYDDARRVFIVRNSWANTWGKRGYGTIPYAYLLDENLSDDFWTIRVVQ